MTRMLTLGAVALLSVFASAFAAGEGETAAVGDVIEVHSYNTVSHSAGSEAGTAQQVLDDVRRTSRSRPACG